MSFVWLGTMQSILASWVLKDNKAIASRLFGLVNVIVETTIAGPKHVKNIYESIVPESARKAIEKRDTPKLLSSGDGGKEK